MTQLPDELINFVNTKWHRAHKLAMFVHYMKANEPEKAMTQQLLYLAAWMTRRAPVASDDLPETLRYTSLVGLVGALLMLQMNVAATLTIACVGAAMFAIGGGNLRHLVTFVASGLFMWFVVVVSGSNHIDGDFLRLPLTQTAHPDTEAGLILVLLGTSTAILVWRGFRAACASVEPFGAVLAAGISSWFAYEALVRIAAATGLLPNAGLMSLPYDDSLRPVMLFAAAGLLIALSSRSSRDAMRGSEM